MLQSLLAEIIWAYFGAIIALGYLLRLTGIRWPLPFTWVVAIEALLLGVLWFFLDEYATTTQLVYTYLFTTSFYELILKQITRGLRFNQRNHDRYEP